MLLLIRSAEQRRRWWCTVTIGWSRCCEWRRWWRQQSISTSGRLLQHNENNDGKDIKHMMDYIAALKHHERQLLKFLASLHYSGSHSWPYKIGFSAGSTLVFILCDSSSLWALCKHLLYLGTICIRYFPVPYFLTSEYPYSEDNNPAILHRCMH